MRGKDKCKILKEIRQKIADENEIPYITRECRFQGECKGTCPRCESELRYLEQQLALRASLGKTVRIAALCAGMTMAVAGCGSLSANAPSGGQNTGTGSNTQLADPGQNSGNDSTNSVVIIDVDKDTGSDPEVYVLEGEIAEPYDYGEDDELAGAAAPPDDSECTELTGEDSEWSEGTELAGEVDYEGS